MPELDVIVQTIRSIPFVKNLSPLQIEDLIIIGEVEVSLPDSEESLAFEIQIYPHYPFKTHDSESIRFINTNLRAYNHVMHDGSICIHTAHCSEYHEKLRIDFDSLYSWIIKYYTSQDDDKHYEHIIVEHGLISGSFHSHIFSDVDYSFNSGEYGTVQLAFLNSGTFKGSMIHNLIVRSFTTIRDEIIDCNWSDTYKSVFPEKHTGVFVYLENPPIYDGKFIIEDWCELKDYFQQEFIDYLSQFIKNNDKAKNPIIPLFVGYKTVDSEIHWQVAAIDPNDPPLKSDYENNSSLILLPTNTFDSRRIAWAFTENASYKNYFGRGKLCDKLTDSTILIVGIGAIGSILGKSLVKGGCREIWTADYDVKNIENVCRSEYTMTAGLSDKVAEFNDILIANSPHVDLTFFQQGYIDNLIKIFFKFKKGKDSIKEQFGRFDYIFDCSTDNDLMYMLDELEPDCEVVNLSISNHANELVCAFSPNIYNNVTEVFENVISQSDDLYEPTGCWSPTFKASYTDINLLVQMSLKQINNIIQGKSSKNNFLVRPDEHDDGLRLIKF